VPFDPSDKLDDIATAASSLDAATSELLDDVPPFLQKQTLEQLRSAVDAVTHVIAQLEDQRETFEGR
jgi:ABC-type transporter Mla subunit MlaD